MTGHRSASGRQVIDIDNLVGALLLGANDASPNATASTSQSLKISGRRRTGSPHWQA